MSWTTSSVEPGTPIETNSAAAGGGCAGKQSTDQLHPWLDSHYFTRPGEDPLSAFSYVFDASPRPPRQSTARTHRRARSSKATTYGSRALPGRAVTSATAPSAAPERGLAPGLQHVRRGEHGRAHLPPRESKLTSLIVALSARKPSTSHHDTPQLCPTFDKEMLGQRRQRQRQASIACSTSSEEFWSLEENSVADEDIPSPGVRYFDTAEEFFEYAHSLFLQDSGSGRPEKRQSEG